MADHDPMQPVGGSPLAPAAPNDALKAVYDRGKALRDPAGCGIGNQQSSEDCQRVEGGRSSEGNQASDTEDGWTIDALHGHIECLHGEGDHFSKASADAIGWCLERIEALTATVSVRERALDALSDTLKDIGFAIGYEAGCDAHEVVVRVRRHVEALTAENARLSARLEISPDHPYDGIACRDETIHQQDRLIAELRAEAQELRLQCLSHEGQAHAAYEAQKRAEAEVEALTAKLGKYTMPPWEADACKREAMAARRALCMGEHSQNVAPADIYDRIVAMRAANETRREDVR